MERALFISSGLTPSLVGYDRLYCGSEFCPWTFPSFEEIERCMDLARRASLPLTLVTPVFSEFFTESLEKILCKVFPDFLPLDEIVISDWGAFPLIQKCCPGLEIVVGRTLSGQKRGPQILDLDLSDEQLHYFQESRFYSQEARLMLEELGIRRIELDSPPQGISAVPSPLQATVHTPYAMVTSSRNCPFRSGGGSHGCAVSCGEIFILTTPLSPLPLLQGGNTQFVMCSDLPEKLETLRVDRIVTHLVLPR